MEHILGTTFIGYAVNKLLDEVLTAFRLMKNCSANLRQLQNILERLQPSVRELSSVEDEKDIAGKWLAKLREQLSKSLELVHGYGNSRINITHFYRTSKESLDVYENIQALLQEASVLQWASGLSFQNIWLENNQKMWAEMRAGMTALQEELARHAGLLIARSSKDFRRTMSQFLAEDFEISAQSSCSSTPIEMLNTDSASNIPNPDSTFGQAVADMLTNHLLSRDCQKWVGVWGMGGIGKTFTASKVYRDSQIQQEFSGGTYWVTISKDPNHLFLELLRKTGSQPSASNSQLPKCLDAVKAYLRGLLDMDRVLLVLDDVWQKDIIDFLDVAPNTKKNVVLVTTRDQEIFRNVIDNIDIFEIPRLSPEDSWQLFSYHAFHARGKTVPRELEAVARHVAEECCNLPLALEVIGSTMGNKRLLPAERALRRTLLDVWDAALKRLRSVNHEKNEYEVLYKKLQLSVDSLPEQDFRLKDCFFYFAAFPEDQNVDIERLVTIWVSEGLVVEDPHSSLSGEEAGRLLLMCLVAKSMLEVTQGGYCCKIHDVMRDLVHLNLKWDFVREKQIQPSARICLFAPGLRESKLPEDWTTSAIPSSAKRLSFGTNDLRQFPDPEHFHAPNLQTLFLQSNESLKTLSIRFFQSLPNLKVLDISRTAIEKVPGALLERLTSLVLLDVSWCGQLQEMDDVNSLRSLEVFHFSGCGKLKKLPRVNRLTKLKCYAGEMMRVEETMDASNRLRCWQISRPRPSQYEKSTRGRPYMFPPSLRHLTISQGKKYLIEVSSLQFLETLIATDTSYPAGIERLHHLKNLRLIGCNGSSVRDVSSLGLLEEFFMRGVPSFPTGMTELSRLKILSLRDCNDTSVPALGQLPLLEDLSMEFNQGDGLRSYGCEGAFPSLISLQLFCGVDMEMFVFHPGTMPQIVSLSIWMSKREHFPASVTELLTLKRFEVRLTSAREDDSFGDDIEVAFRQPECLPELEFLSIKGSFGAGRVRKRLELKATAWPIHILERHRKGLLALDIDGDIGCPES